MRINYFCIVSLFSLLIASTSLASDVVVEFSATAVQKAPDRPEYLAQMYIGDNIVRKDSVQNNIQTIEIIKSKELTRLFLIPKEKIYLQHKGSNPEAQVTPEKSASIKPCEGLINTTCELLGKEEINGRMAEKWEYAEVQDSQVYSSLHWVDVKHRMFVREFYPDGTVTELLPLGTEKMNGRNTEKWLWQITGPDAQTRSSTQWYDPELKITIREEIQGGFIRELRNIKVGKQDKKLFEIPNGYKQVEDLQSYLQPQQPVVNQE